MDSKTLSPSPDNADAKAAFRKPSNDAANRKYRRRSPVSGSSSSDGCEGRSESSGTQTDNQETSGVQAEKQMEQLQLELEKQYTAGLRRRDGRTVGLRL